MTKDILNNFILIDDFTFAELVVYNYARRYPSKSATLGYASVFLSSTRAKVAYNDLKRFGYIVEHIDYSLETPHEHTRNIIPIFTRPKAGRPLRPTQDA